MRLYRNVERPDVDSWIQDELIKNVNPMNFAIS